MDTIVRPVWESFKTTDFVVQLALSDLDDKTARRRLDGDSGPSIAWELGHLLSYRLRIMALLGQAGDNPSEAQFDGTSNATDGTDYPTIEEFGRQWKNRHSELERVIGRTTEEQLDTPLPDAGPHEERKLYDALMFLVWHEAYHCGQIGTLRTHFGLPPLSRLATQQAQEASA